MRRRGTVRALVVLPALALTLSACSLSNTDTGGGSADLAKGSIAKNYHLKGKTFSVGSKEFTENLILGKITIDALRAGGAKVTDHTKLSGSNTVRKAQLSGDIDMYWDYAGTGWELYLKHDTPVKGDQAQFDKTAAEDQAKNHVTWLGPAKFGDAYGIAVRSNAPGDLGKVETYSDIATFITKHPDQATFCGASEFYDRQFGPFQKAYGMKFPPKQVHTNDLNLDYTNVAKGKPCNFAEIFTTDARVSTQHLKVLTDDKGAFYTQLASLTVRQSVAKANPELSKLATALGNKLTQSTMIKLNKMVDVDGKTPDQAAEYFLKSNGFIG